MVFSYTHEEPLVLTDLKNKYFNNFYKFLTMAYNYYDQEYLLEYNSDDIRIAEPRRPSNEIPFDLAYNLARDMVDDFKEVMNHFRVITITNAPFSEPAGIPIQFGPALPY